MIVLIDNYDSFVFNVARYFEELGHPVTVIRNDAVSVDEIKDLQPSALVISPGPCSPAEAGISCDVIRAFSGALPILGICLGHQCIGDVFGHLVTRAERPMHGRSSQIYHNGTDMFRGLPTPFRAARYHSLIVEMQDETNSPLTVTARSEDGEVMATAHRVHPTVGVQFHPESILTEHGHTMLKNFLEYAR
ncbi:anthranilate synthase component II [Coralliovum pocilloporae]|uniref:anthranilate synthase component II n=1 Tax=Coralliovum pocilloporae TaxID=3066369 RepID=UPI00330705CC